MSESHSKQSVDDGHFVQLLAKHEPEIRAFIRASLPSSHDVAEVMQNVSLIAWKKFRELNAAETDFARWVCVIARFEILKFRRSLARDRFVLDDDLVQMLCEEGEVEISQRAEEARQLEHCLERLPDARREFVLEAYKAGTSIVDLARQRGKKPDAMYQLLRRIRLELEACIRRRLGLVESNA